MHILELDKSEKNKQISGPNVWYIEAGTPQDTFWLQVFTSSWPKQRAVNFIIAPAY